MTRCLLCILAIVAASRAYGQDAAPNVSFQRDIRPILSDKCFRCHGPDAASRAARLRLDQRAEATADRGGYAAIVPGDPAASALIDRITSRDPDHRMPPRSTNKSLSTREIDLLRRWVEQGAVYEGHWAFEPLVKPSPPPVESAANAIDAFVTARLREHGLNLAALAEPETLLRRVTLDLTGLPPTLDDLESFRSDIQRSGSLDAAYERVVDRLLHSPHFGEHLAAPWLDAARYADTNGYFGDKPRQMWLWRDWVIDAFNANMPFDQFTIEQLAGDLLPAATPRQRIATGFNRNHMANNETGIIDEEFRVEYVVDRVHTTMTAWLGLSAGCAQCHDHKFDPISQREFYQLFAFFNNVPESGLIHADNPPPLLEVPSADQSRRLAELSQAVREAAEAFEPIQKQLVEAIARWESDDAPSVLPHPPDRSVILHDPFDGAIHSSANSVGTTVAFEPGIRGQAAKFDASQHVELQLRDFQPDGPWTIGLWLKPDGSLSCPLSLIEPTGDRRGIEILWGKGLAKVHLVNQWGVRLIEASTVEPMSAKNWHHVAVTYDGSQKANGLRVFVDGVPARLEVHRDTLSGGVGNSEPLRIGRRDSGLGFYGLIDEVRIVQESLSDAAVSDWYWGDRIRGIVSVAASDRSARDSEVLLDYYVDRFADGAARAGRERVKEAKRAEQQLRASIPTVLVMQELDKPRVAHVLERGQYDRQGEAVEPGVPAALASWPEGAPRNRLGLAQWLVSPANPLTPRVAANRLWQHCFGQGLVRTVDDFGSQGEVATHPALLDWLAATFRDSGWDVKGLIRVIVTSRTYRQRSQAVVSESGVFDPENRLWGRGPSVRLSAEMVRDQALAVSGLLVGAIGGPSVRPYQPPGLWEAVSYNGEESYEADRGSGLWRRGVYTYIKRQAPPPGLLTFDGPTREKCSMQRTPTNTPLQALTLLNDDTFVEAARALAARSLAVANDDADRLRHLWTRVLSRDVRPGELRQLAGLLERQRGRFAADPAAAARLVSVGARPVESNGDMRELAAWTVVAQAVLNLDEAITKR